MSLALPAELNGFPGPVHVLELADALQLTPEQRRKTADLVQQMRLRAKGLGQEVIEAEVRLDRLFSSGEPNEATLADAVENAAMIQARLRTAHLSYHLAMVRILTPQQAAVYNDLRGYAGHQ